MHDVRHGAPSWLRLCMLPTWESLLARAGAALQQKGPASTRLQLVSICLPTSPQVLIADFFFILFALAWLGAALAERSALQSTVSGPDMSSTTWLVLLPCAWRNLWLAADACCPCNDTPTAVHAPCTCMHHAALHAGSLRLRPFKCLGCSADAR